MSGEHILIVDDDPALLEALSEMLQLRMDEIAVDRAESAPVALEFIAKNDYEAIVSDIKMPGMDGLALLARVHELRPNTPTLLITGHGQHDLAVQALRGGAYDFIQKPIDREYFVASLSRALHMRRLHRQVEVQRQALERHALELKETVDVRTRELREANQAKDEFLALLAHELRNPLAPILNAVGLIASSEGNGEVVHQAARVVERQVHQMARLLDDLLDVSRISRGKLRLRKEIVYLAELVERAVQTSRPLIESRRHQLTVSVPEEPIAVEADATRLEQVLANLLNNAAKYTNPGGRIEVMGAVENSQAVLRIRDTGKGIPPTMIQRIFEPFVQVDFSLHRSEQGGLGIGLMLVRRLMEMHGGTVSAFSAGPGLGSEFAVRLPALPADQTPAPLPETKELENGKEPIKGKSRHVLIVEDNADSRETLRTLLTLWGHQVTVAENGPRGVEKALTTQPEIALVDIGLPDLDGYQVAEQVRAAPQGDGIYLIALTGYGQQGDRRRSLHAGFNAHLVKPVDPKELARMLAEARVEPSVN
ncbi:MAG TPA: response regulator [Gemmataceae bacterium]|jgi:signal transduction histidine kinase|nr:response regulator [Gemmataceae bacterium]